MNIYTYSNVFIIFLAIAAKCTSYTWQRFPRAFEYSAPHLWNKLPLNVRNAARLGVFKSVLKTHLFKQAFY